MGKIVGEYEKFNGVEYIIELSDDLTKQMKTYIDSYLTTIYGFNFDTKKILCEVENKGNEGIESFMCFVEADNFPITPNLETIPIPEVEKGYFNSEKIIFENSEIPFRNIFNSFHDKIYSDVMGTIMKNNMEKI